MVSPLPPPSPKSEYFTQSIVDDGGPFWIRSACFETNQGHIHMFGRAPVFWRGSELQLVEPTCNIYAYIYIYMGLCLFVSLDEGCAWGLGAVVNFGGCGQFWGLWSILGESYFVFAWGFWERTITCMLSVYKGETRGRACELASNSCWAFARML